MNHRAFSKIWIVIILVLLVAGGIFAWRYFTTSKEKVAVTKLTTIPEGYESPYETTFNPAIFTSDGKQAIYIAKKEGKYFIFVNNKKSGPYDDISFPIVSSDGKKIAYIAEKEGKQCIVVNGREGKLYEHILKPISIHSSNIVFSPDNNHIAYIAEKNKKKFVVVDEREGKIYDEIYPVLTFSPDSKKIAYVASKNNKGFVVTDEEEHEAYDNLSALHEYLSRVQSPFVFSPDSKHFAYVKIKGNKFSVVIDGKEGKAYNYALPPTFSPDSSHFAYFAKKGGNGTVIITDKEEIEGGKDFIFSPDSSHFAYLKQKNIEEGTTVFVDDKAIGSYEFVDNLIFSPNSKRIAYLIYENGKMFTVINGERSGKGYNFVYGKSLTFSPDNRHLAYIASDKVASPQQLNEDIERMNAIQNAFVVIDGRESKEYTAIFVSPFTFSPDSKHFTYVAADKKGRFVVLDNREGERYFLIYPDSLTFSPDSKHLAYKIQVEAKGKFSIIVDGRRSKIYDWNGDPIFSSDSKYVRYGAQIGNEIWWIVNEIE